MSNETRRSLPELDQAKPPKTDRFYIVLGSMVPLIEDPKTRKLRAYMLYIKDHSHVAGQWLFEKDVPLGLNAKVKGLADCAEKVPRLKGVESPLVRTKSIIDPSHPAVYACFDLPCPNKIYYCNQNGIKVYDDPKNPDLKYPPKSVSGTRILEYELSKPGDFDVSLVDTVSKRTWWSNERRKTDFGKVSVGSLHLIDAPRRPDLEDEHNPQEHLLNLAMLGAKKVKVVELSKPSDPKLHPPPGLTNWEILDYHYRPAIVQAVTYQLRTGKKTRGGDATIREGGCDGCCAPADGQTGP